MTTRQYAILALLFALAAALAYGIAHDWFHDYERPDVRAGDSTKGGGR